MLFYALFIIHKCISQTYIVMTKFLTATTRKSVVPVIAKKQASATISKKPLAYKKSVSTSLVFRPLKFDQDGYIGFKVTYSGKGGKGNVSNKFTIILIPDVNFNKSYRPIAGALARATRGEVLVCAYNKVTRPGLNEQMIQTIVDRIGKVGKGKVKSTVLMSENERILDLFKERMTTVLPGAEAEFVDVHSSPKKISVETTKLGSPKKRRRNVKLIRISLDKPVNVGIVSRMMGAVKRLFVKPEETLDPNTNIVENSGRFQFCKTVYSVDGRLNLRNANHCDLIAADILRV